MKGAPANKADPIAQPPAVAVQPNPESRAAPLHPVSEGATPIGQERISAPVHRLMAWVFAWAFRISSPPPPFLDLQRDLPVLRSIMASPRLWISSQHCRIIFFHKIAHSFETAGDLWLRQLIPTHGVVTKKTSQAHRPTCSPLLSLTLAL